MNKYSLFGMATQSIIVGIMKIIELLPNSEITVESQVHK